MTVGQMAIVILVFAVNFAIPLWLMWAGEQHSGY